MNEQAQPALSGSKTYAPGSLHKLLPMRRSFRNPSGAGPSEQRQGGGFKVEARPGGAAASPWRAAGPEASRVPDPASPTSGGLGFSHLPTCPNQEGALGGSRQLSVTGRGPGRLPTAGAAARQPSNHVSPRKLVQGVFFLCLPFSFSSPPPQSCKTQKIDLCLKRRR